MIWQRSDVPQNITAIIIGVTDSQMSKLKSKDAKNSLWEWE